MTSSDNGQGHIESGNRQESYPYSPSSLHYPIQAPPPPPPPLALPHHHHPSSSPCPSPAAYYRHHQHQQQHHHHHHHRRQQQQHQEHPRQHQASSIELLELSQPFHHHTQNHPRATLTALPVAPTSSRQATANLLSRHYHHHHHHHRQQQQQHDAQAQSQSAQYGPGPQQTYQLTAQRPGPESQRIGILTTSPPPPPPLPPPQTRGPDRHIKATSPTPGSSPTTETSDENRACSGTRLHHLLSSSKVASSGDLTGSQENHSCAVGALKWGTSASSPGIEKQYRFPLAETSLPAEPHGAPKPDVTCQLAVNVTSPTVATTPPSKPPTQRQSISLRTKLDIIELATSSKLSQQQVAARYGISRPAVTRILKRKHEFLTIAASQSLDVSKRFRLQRGKFEELERRLYAWYLECRSQDRVPSGNVLQDQAVRLAAELRQELGKESGGEFKASNGWLEGFKKRYNISGKRGGAVWHIVTTTPTGARALEPANPVWAQHAGAFASVADGSKGGQTVLQGSETTPFPSPPIIGGDQNLALSPTSSLFSGGRPKGSQIGPANVSDVRVAAGWRHSPVGCAEREPCRLAGEWPASQSLPCPACPHAQATGAAADLPSLPPPTSIAEHDLFSPGMASIQLSMDKNPRHHVSAAVKLGRNVAKRVPCLDGSNMTAHRVPAHPHAGSKRASNRTSPAHVIPGQQESESRQHDADLKKQDLAPSGAYPGLLERRPSEHSQERPLYHHHRQQQHLWHAPYGTSHTSPLAAASSTTPAPSQLPAPKEILTCIEKLVTYLEATNLGSREDILSLFRLSEQVRQEARATLWPLQVQLDPPCPVKQQEQQQRQQHKPSAVVAAAAAGPMGSAHSSQCGLELLSEVRDRSHVR